MNVLVTGGASGLGKSITEKIAQQSNTLVYFTYSESKKNAQEIESIYNNAKAIHCDFTILGSVNKLVEQISILNIDVIINNAFWGSISKQYFHKINGNEFSESFKYNIEPVILINQEVIKLFRKKKSGRIITILSSVLINKSPIGWSNYTAQKAYLHSLSKSWAIENAAFNITSNSISPSLMLTGLTADTDERILEEIVNKHPLKKLLDTDEVANTVVFLLYASNHINGSNIVINAASDVI